ncbi:ABC transporter permease [Kibdelosporangium persicum]|uniref:Transport permease protein n=1 Tax=Kibdelosporangium persicum TaxID=2698649 RepID=A0ABX2F5W0_9PSEU|nr:ABC transporter permease [Kibdelosporangium persicum]NRN66730.1 ABC transporter [Kibdelosporangium persicum]
MSVGLVWRVVPPGLYARRARTVVERSFLVNRRAWMTIFSGFFESFFYLFAMGVGFGRLVGEVIGPGGQPMSYAAYVAPALLAASAMNGAVYDATFNLFFKLKYAKVYDGMLATPLGPFDVAIGEISWALIRGAVYATGFLTVISVLGLVSSPWTILALPVVLLVSLAFAAVGMACTTFMRSWQDFDLVQLALLPMFLFSATFYPLSVYPDGLQWVVRLSPLYHAVELMRGLTAGVIEWAMLGHLSYFVVMAVVGLIVAGRRLGKLLLS